MTVSIVQDTSQAPLVLQIQHENTYYLTFSTLYAKTLTNAATSSPFNYVGIPDVAGKLFASLTLADEPGYNATLIKVRRPAVAQNISYRLNVSCPYTYFPITRLKSYPAFVQNQANSIGQTVDN